LGNDEATGVSVINKKFHPVKAITLSELAAEKATSAEPFFRDLADNHNDLHI
jgi:hypothetical protein